MSKQELAAELCKYLKKHLGDKDFWHRDQIGKHIREFCEHRGNFKASPRGNPSKGYNKMVESMNPNMYE